MDCQMPTPKGQPKSPSNGRRKGTLNKKAQQAKELVASSAERLGRADQLAAWAREDRKNEQIFWGRIYPSLSPLQVSEEITEPSPQTICNAVTPEKFEEMARRVLEKT